MGANVLGESVKKSNPKIGRSSKVVIFDSETSKGSIFGTELSNSGSSRSSISISSFNGLPVWTPSFSAIELAWESGRRSRNWRSSDDWLNKFSEEKIRIVEKGNLAKFVEIIILEDSEEGLWVTGIPEKVEIIIQGQGFVEDEQEVITNRIWLR